MPVTPLLGTQFGTPGALVSGRQRKIWFPGDNSYASIAAKISASGWASQPTGTTVAPQDFGLPDVPVAEAPAPAESASSVELPEVRYGYVGEGPTYVPTSVVTVGDVSTEVEHHPEGDFPAGSIFAPGQTWGVSTDLDTAPDVQEDDVALGDIIDWGLETLAGQQPWQTFGAAATPPPVMNFGAPNVPAPSGIPGQPGTVYGYTGGTAVTSGGDCGNRRYVTLDRETGKISCKRRRRRRLLTNRDLADLASLKTITGGGAALNAAVIRAVR